MFPGYIALFSPMFTQVLVAVVASYFITGDKLENAVRRYYNVWLALYPSWVQAIVWCLQKQNCCEWLYKLLYFSLPTQQYGGAVMLIVALMLVLFGNHMVSR